ncbi:MAG: polysaccharide biosynthesis protein [Bacteroidetes bacterium]|nr:polysaccharide biosynthesis protein [Bacteroidota bacterium]
MIRIVPQNNTPRWVIIVIDLLISLFSLAFAYLIRFDLKADSELITEEWQILSKSLPFYIVIKIAVFYSFKIHKGLIRHTSTDDLKRIFLASFICSVVFGVLGILRSYFIDGVYLFPISVLILEFFVSIFFLVGTRFTFKVMYLESIKSKDTAERVLIYGAGISGLITKRTIEKDVRISYHLIGFIDDNEKLNKTRLEGKSIFHTSRLKSIIEDEGITMVVLAIQNPNPEKQKQVIDVCLEHNVKVQKVPSPKSWINGEFSTKQIGKIKIEDLLGRPPISLDVKAISNDLKNKRVLVTGAAGSIGSGLVRQLLKYKPATVYLLDQSESALYDFHMELIAENPSYPIEVIIGDIRNERRMARLFKHALPHLVFHAAAYKHVPLMENNPSEAVLTNVCGTRNLVDAALKVSVEKFVMISTDKAVNPTNVMGASKRIAEMYAQKSNQVGSTKFITTRFGNVLGSNGSVIPLFQKQIDQGGPVTLTDERITRFFMTIPEACELVLEACAMGEGGEIFVFDMGESVKIIDLAKKMIRLSGLELGTDIEIKITGLRPGEKLYEELLAKDENTLPTHHSKILKAKVRTVDWDVSAEISSLVQLFDNQDNEMIVAKMKDMVPEFVSNNSEYEKLDKK